MNVDIHTIEEIIKSHRDPELFSGVVLLTQGDHILFEGAFGYAIRSESISNRINTRFQTASGCKVFTSLAVCKLVEQGNLSFDTRLKACVDADFPNFAPEITIRHLLTHSSGITSYFEEDINPDYESLWQRLPMYKVRNPRDFLPLFQDKGMKFSPGERFEYNDGGYILLGLVVEAAAGNRYPEIIDDDVFIPAEMTDSGYFQTDQLPERTAYAYIPNPDGSWRTNFFAVPIIGAPDGGAYTTAPDMVKFWKALTHHQLLSSPMTTHLLEAQILTSLKPPFTHYGYGIWIERTDGSTRKFFVEGYDPGVSFRSALYPDTGVTLTMIGNTAAALWPLYTKLEGKLDL